MPLSVPLIFGKSDDLAVLIASLLISVDTLAAINEGLFLSTIFSASSKVLGNLLITDFINFNESKFLGNV